MIPSVFQKMMSNEIKPVIVFHVKVEFVHSVDFRNFVIQFVTYGFWRGQTFYFTTRDLKNHNGISDFV